MSCLINKSPVCPKSSLSETLARETRFSYGPWYLWPSFVDCAVWLTIGKVCSEVVRSSCWERGRDALTLARSRAHGCYWLTNALLSSVHIVYSVVRHRLRCWDLKIFWLCVCCSLNCAAMRASFLTKSPCSLWGSVSEGLTSPGQRGSKDWHGRFLRKMFTGSELQFTPLVRGHHRATLILWGELGNTYAWKLKKNGDTPSTLWLNARNHSLSVP